MRLVFVHGACVRDAAWWWHKMVEPLAERGIRSRAVELPSCADDPQDLYADVDAVRAVLAEDDEPAVLLGHSYGGTVITDAGHDQATVRQLIYLASLLPDVGQSQASVVGAEPAPWLDLGADGTIGVRPDSVRELFVNDCDQETADQAVARLTRQAAVAFGQPVRAAAWRRVPSTYVVCTADLATPEAVQRERAAQAGRIEEIASGHHPFLSRPDDFAALLADIIR
jgi:pimeloyl-ACP methyl ester carboxylesterase